MSEQTKSTTEFSVAAAIHNIHNTPAVAINLNGSSIFPDPAEAREMALAILACAQESETDAIMVQLAIRKGASIESAHQMLAEFREEKRKVRGDAR